MERKIAEFHGREDAILYASCFDANAGLFEVLLGANDAVISDELNHASIIDGIRLTKAKRLRYSHRDINGQLTQLSLASCPQLTLLFTQLSLAIRPQSEITQIVRDNNNNCEQMICYNNNVIESKSVVVISYHIRELIYQINENNYAHVSDTHC